jgi:hypothetical protein
VADSLISIASVPPRDVSVVCWSSALALNEPPTNQPPSGAAATALAPSESTPPAVQSHCTSPARSNATTKMSSEPAAGCLSSPSSS